MHGTSAALCAAPQTGVDVDEFEEALYHITHDLRAMLRATRTIPEWLREDLESEGRPLSETVSSSLGMLEASARRADTLLDDLLTYSRVGRCGDPVSTFDIASAVLDAAARVGVPETFVIETCLEAPELTAPRNDCVTLLATLLSNAVIHRDSPSGNISIASYARDGSIVLSVEDDGPGIPEVHRASVFDMMKRLKSRDAREGSGLGLSIARKIVLGWGGDIRARGARAGRGTRIEVTLPDGTG